MNQPAEPIPFEFGAAAGIALVASGQFPVAIIALVVWFILRRIKPIALTEITVVTSIRIGTALLACTAVAMGIGPLSVLTEVSLVSIVALLLFFTNRPEWAYILILHSGYVAYHRVLDFQSTGGTDVQHSLLGTIALQCLIIWLLVSYLRRPKPSVEKVVIDSPSNENS